MKVSVYNLEGKETGQIVLPKEMFDLEPNSDLLHQVVVSQMANRRKVIANTKGRGMVRGGGKKPWRQKGTGRARHGSRRSPIWKGGGVTFGPTKERVFKKKINKKMGKKALFMALSDKAKNNLLFVLDNFSIEKQKTKIMNNILKSFPFDGKVLIALPNSENKIIRATRNIAGIETIKLDNLNALDILSFKYLILPKEGIKLIKEIFSK
ncbi:MAG: 50S ribosomal protein L4 [Candidatus Nealsonbacteria bacterium]